MTNKKLYIFSYTTYKGEDKTFSATGRNLTEARNKFLRKFANTNITVNRVDISKKKVHTTWTVVCWNKSTHGLNETFYFRTEQEAKTRLHELQSQYKDITSQMFELTFHDWSE